MGYKYKSLEQALEQAAYRLPVSILGRLITQVEDVIAANADGAALERRIYGMISEFTSGQQAFSLKKLEQNNNSPLSAVAEAA